MATELAATKRLYRICLSCFKGKLEVRLDYLDSGTACCGQIPEAIISMPVYRFDAALHGLKFFEPEIHCSAQIVAGSTKQGVIGRIYLRLLYHGAGPSWAKTTCQQLEACVDLLETQVYDLDPEFSELVARAYTFQEQLARPVLMLAVGRSGRMVVSTFDRDKYYVHTQNEAVAVLPPFVACDLAIDPDRYFERPANCLTADDVRFNLLVAFEKAGLDVARQEIFGPEIVRDICTHKH